jgi:hypothetical protein
MSSRSSVGSRSTASRRPEGAAASASWRSFNVGGCQGLPESSSSAATRCSCVRPSRGRAKRQSIGEIFQKIARQLAFKEPAEFQLAPDLRQVSVEPQHAQRIATVDPGAAESQEQFDAVRVGCVGDLPAVELQLMNRGFHQFPGDAAFGEFGQHAQNDPFTFSVEASSTSFRPQNGCPGIGIAAAVAQADPEPESINDAGRSSSGELAQQRQRQDSPVSRISLRAMPDPLIFLAGSSSRAKDTGNDGAGRCQRGGDIGRRVDGSKAARSFPMKAGVPATADRHGGKNRRCSVVMTPVEVFEIRVT